MQLRFARFFGPAISATRFGLSVPRPVGYGLGVIRQAEHLSIRHADISSHPTIRSAPVEAEGKIISAVDRSCRNKNLLCRLTASRKPASLVRRNGGDRCWRSPATGGVR